MEHRFWVSIVTWRKPRCARLSWVSTHCPVNLSTLRTAVVNQRPKPKPQVTQTYIWHTYYSVWFNDRHKTQHEVSRITDSSIWKGIKLFWKRKCFYSGRLVKCMWRYVFFCFVEWCKCLDRSTRKTFLWILLYLRNVSYFNHLRSFKAKYIFQ